MRKSREKKRRKGRRTLKNCLLKYAYCLPFSLQFFLPFLLFLYVFNTLTPKLVTKQASSHSQIKSDVHFLVSWQTEGAAVRQLHDVDGETLVSGFVTEAELHLRAAQRQPLLVGAQEEVCREARPGGDANTQTQELFIKISCKLRSTSDFILFLFSNDVMTPQRYRRYKFSL